MVKVRVGCHFSLVKLEHTSVFHSVMINILSTHSILSLAVFILLFLFARCSFRIFYIVLFFVTGNQRGFEIIKKACYNDARCLHTVLLIFQKWIDCPVISRREGLQVVTVTFNRNLLDHTSTWFLQFLQSRLKVASFTSSTSRWTKAHNYSASWRYLRSLS